jgi:hypothetical protein
MKLSVSIAFAVFSTTFALAQVSPNLSLSAGTTIPISFQRSVDPGHEHAGDVIAAKTTQQIQLANGQILAAGARVTGHVIAANGFSFDKTPYAKQKASTLTIRFDSIESKNGTIPLQVYVRAMADPLTVWAAQEPKSTDLDPLGTTTQIGGDLVTPSQAEVESQDGDTVGYSRRGGVYAHLISATGRGSTSCDASNTEQSMGLFSASACGLYGYTDVALLGNGKSGDVSTLTLASQRHSVKIWARSSALLEVVGDNSGTISQ